MKALQLRHPFGKSWFIAGSAVMSALLVSILLRDFANDAAPADWLRLWRYFTGVILLILFAYQWTLFLARRSSNVALIRKRYKRHKYAGVAFLFLFLLHAGAIGHGIMAVVGLGLIAIAATGLFNAEVLLLSPEALRRARLFIHYAVSAALIPLIILHVWTALSFK